VECRVLAYYCSIIEPFRTFKPHVMDFDRRFSEKVIFQVRSDYRVDLLLFHQFGILTRSDVESNVILLTSSRQSRENL